MKIKRAHIITFSLIFGFTFCCGYYITNEYSVFSKRFDTVKIECNKSVLEQGLPILYAYRENNTKLDFTKVYRFKKTNDSTIVLTGLINEDISGFRIYFEYPGNGFQLKNIKFSRDEEIIRTVHLSEINYYSKIDIWDNNYFNVHEPNGFIELPFKVIYNFPFLYILMTILLLNIVLIFLLMEGNIFGVLSSTTKHDIIWILFVISIFSFHPLYNLFLILGLVFYTKHIKLELLISNKVNLLFFSFFLIYLLNSIFIRKGEIQDFSVVEKYLPFLFIPILFSSVNAKKGIYFIMISGLFLSFSLFSFALIDFTITSNVEYFSFENISKYFHPVYVSYILFVSIFYLEHSPDIKHKSIFQLFLFLMLVFLGSKLVLVVSVILYLIFHINTKLNLKKVLLGATILLMCVLIFEPLKNRFNKILNFDDFSVLQEEYIDSNDSRINGLTIRLIVWKEVLLTSNGWKEYVFGQGVSKSKFKELSYRLNKKGLKNHSYYNPHNQFVDTFWRTGIFGLCVLLAIPFVAFVVGLRNKNKLLMAFCLFMFFSMLTESIFGRVRGVYFFTTVIILLTNYNLYAKNSHTRYQRDSKSPRRI